MNTDALNIILLNVGKAIRNADWVYTDVCSPFARIYCIGSSSPAKPTPMASAVIRMAPLSSGSSTSVPRCSRMSTAASCR